MLATDERTKPPASQRVLAPDCEYCRSDNTHIYSTKGVKRYCKCRRCGWTWSITVTHRRPGGDHLIP